jgi:predicted Zn-dependent protease
MRKYIILSLVFISVALMSCEFMKKAYNTSSDAVANVNVFPYTQDIELGKQVQQEIAANPTEYPVLAKNSNRQVYQYIDGLKNTILNSGQLKYKDEFEWEVTLIDDDETLNAFATPGGYIYIYTGLIKFLDSEDELIGVLGHEMAHSDRRHSTRQLTKSLGLSILLGCS